MDASSRDRSPLRHAAAANINLTPTFTPPQDETNTTLHNAFDAQAFNDQSFNATLDRSQFFSNQAFANFTQPAQQSTPLTLDELANLHYDSNNLSPHSFSNTTSPGHESNTFPSFEFSDSTLNDIDLLQPSSNFGDNYSNMTSTMNTHAPTPPHLLPGMARKSSSPSPQASPNIQQAPYMNRPRNTSESLGPESALLPQSGEWAYVNGARGHRRMHSDNLSEISSHSAQASPYLSTMESFDSAHQASPLLNAQDPTFSDGLGIGQFSISDSVVHRQSYPSPGHSPHVSPNLLAQQQRLPQFTAADNFGLNTNINGQYMQGNEIDAYGQEAFPALGHGISPSDMGQADHLSPPEISIDFAPPLKQNTHLTMMQAADDSLVPPPRTNRTRAKSDSHAGSGMRPTAFQRGRSPSLQPTEALSPFDHSAPASREQSPARARSGSASGRARSTSASSTRDYLLDLADPQRTPSLGENNKRQQKHPATFQCHLCPKRFTRAYNLRSHLRTHTDERPFVCTVCDKAFARQHDRKRHEGLHSGEKKFVCRGPLKNGGQWGCSRRFARADALGRHFRSEAGRVCIKPLLEEENDERQQQFWQEQAAVQAQSGLMPELAQQMPFFPQALLQQYPALAGFDWSQPQTGIPEDEYGGRSSFDASSGGEMYDELSENEMGIGSMNVNPGFGTQQQQQQQLQGYSGHSMGDFTNGFEGR